MRSGKKLRGLDEDVGDKITGSINVENLAQSTSKTSLMK